MTSALLTERQLLLPCSRAPTSSCQTTEAGKGLSFQFHLPCPGFCSGPDTNTNVLLGSSPLTLCLLLKFAPVLLPTDSLVRNIFVSFDNIVYHQCLYSGPNFVESKWSNFRAHVLFHVDPGTNSSPLNLQLATVSRDLMMMKASEDRGFTGLGKPKPPGISVGSCAQGAMKDGKERQQWSCTLQRALHRGSVAFLTITQKEERIQAKLSS